MTWRKRGGVSTERPLDDLLATPFAPDVSNTGSGNTGSSPSFLTRATQENHSEPLECMYQAPGRPNESGFQEWCLVTCLWERPELFLSSSPWEPPINTTHSFPKVEQRRLREGVPSSLGHAVSSYTGQCNRD